MLSDYLEKVKEWFSVNRADLFVAAVIFFVGLSSFGLGRLSVIWPQKEPITIENHESRVMNHGDEGAQGNDKAASILRSVNGRYVASKSGKYYHYPWCPGAQKIKEANKIWFDTKEEAKKAGYKPAGNCSGLSP